MRDMYEAHADFVRCWDRVLEPAVVANPRILEAAKYHMSQRCKTLVALVDDEFDVGSVAITTILNDGVSHGDADYFFQAVSDHWERENT